MWVDDSDEFNRFDNPTRVAVTYSSAIDTWRRLTNPVSWKILRCLLRARWSWLQYTDETSGCQAFSALSNRYTRLFDI